jgi:PAS domain S-box-containing protein
MKQEEAEFLANLFNRTLDLVCIVNKEGWFLKINEAVVHTLGYTEEELLSRPVSSFILPEDQERTAIQRSYLLNNEPLVNFQNRYLSKDGKIIWLHWTSVYIPEKEIVFAIAKNINRQKNIEIEIENNYRKYKSLTAHFKKHVEKDRRFFAYELHEQLAQLATVLKMDFEWIATQKHILDDISRERIDHGLATSHILIDKIRKLSYAINPATIDDEGLDAVLRSLCSEFSSISGIHCSYHSSFEESVLDHEIKLDLLRICQEALLNVMQHADATSVKIHVTQKADKIELSVTDNGRGFEHENKQSFGFRNMHGRAASINGKLSIESAKAKGTKISISVGTKNNN